MNVIAWLEFELTTILLLSRLATTLGKSPSRIVRVPFMGQINLFENYLYLIGILDTVIIIESLWLHGVPWFSFAIRPYHPSLRTGPPGCIQCPHRGWLVLVCPCVGVQKKTSLMSSSCFHQQYATSCSYLEGLRDSKQVTVQLLLSGVLLKIFVQDNTKHSCFVSM